VRPVLERALTKGTPEEQAESLEALVVLGAPADAFLDAARQAAASKQPRLMLHGLLAMAIWAPGEAFAVVRKVFGGQPSGTWFLVTYVLRYLRTDQTVPLLQKLLKSFRGTELEEIAVSALCRHLDMPNALATLLALARAGTAGPVLTRMMTDLARHLPEEQAAEAADAIRGMLKPGMSAAQAGPLLIALGSLGAPQDLHTLGAHVQGDAAEAAIRGIELLSQPSASALLEGVVKSNKPAREAALVALFRLGHPSVPEHLERLSAAADDVPMTARAVTEMTLTVRFARHLGRLAHLYASLGERARNLPPPEAAKPAPRAAESEPESEEKAPKGTAKRGTKAVRAGVQEVLARPRRPVTTDGSVPMIKAAPPEGTGDMLYRDLAKHLQDGEDPAASRKTLLMLAAALVVVVALGGVAWWRASARAAVSADEIGKHSRFPPLYRDGTGEPEERAVNPGDQVEGTRDAPVKLYTRIKDNVLLVKGKLKVVSISFTKDVPPQAEFEGKFLSGDMTVSFPRGQARVVVEGMRTTVDVVNGAAQLDMKESTFFMAVLAGKVRSMRGVIVMKTLEAGQGGEFLDGNPSGRIEDVTIPSEPFLK
jgi:hypothetical protein